jgi:hypothetical protein
MPFNRLGMFTDKNNNKKGKKRGKSMSLQRI